MAINMRPVSQLEFTKNTIKEAKKIKEEIIVNGGTYHEAMQAYLKIISMPKEMLEQFNQDQIDKNSKNSSEDNQTSNQDSVNQ
jgi:F0F1-type ATP synthase epsilon subunit